MVMNTNDQERLNNYDVLIYVTEFVGLRAKPAYGNTAIHQCGTSKSFSLKCSRHFASG